MSRSRLSIIGAFVVGGVLLFAVGLFMIGDRRLLFTDQIQLTTEFSRVRGVAVGTSVRVAGMDAGEVVALAVPPGPGQRFRVTMRIREDLQHLVRTDSVVSILTDGLIGAVYLDVGGGTNEAPVAQPGSVIAGRDAIEFADLIEEGRDTFRTVTREVLDLKEDLSVGVKTLTETTRSANDLIESVGGDVKRITSAGADTTVAIEGLTNDVRRVVANLEAGRGTMGRLLTDDTLYKRIDQIAEHTQESARSMHRTAGEIEQAVRSFRAEDGPADRLRADTQEILGHVRETTERVAQSAEALQRHWLFRGFFTRRGFYDLRDVSVDEYRRGALETDDRIALRLWVDATGLFEVENGREVLSTAGRQRLASAMGSLLRYPRDSTLIVEGYALEGAPDVRFLRSETRAEIVRDYLQRRYRRPAALTGIMPMGSEGDNSPRGDGQWDGVALAIFVRGSAVAASHDEP
ncbi:MAG: MCE family protein [Luteitalea sp.]|nr:MCE family protein [Luteitalea sp.]